MSAPCPQSPTKDKCEEWKTAMYMSHFENILAEGHQPEMMKAYKPRVTQQFDRYLNPLTLKRYVLQSERVRSIVERYEHETRRPLRELQQQVRDIVDEIGLDRNLAIIRWCGMAITAIGKRILNGIHVNAKSISDVRAGLGSSPVLYLPSHRSYMDFILMSYICFHYEIEIPGIAAGMDFHSMFAMGTMLRKTGAFFMRRSFSDDQLYWDIFQEYMYALVSAYHIGVEFFIEGTRSRNFKSLVPKVGLLSMALLPYFTGDVSDVTIIPVSISYERVLEEQLFVYELLGVPKPKESTKGFFKALKIIDEHFGRMYVDFGAPISTRNFFGHTSTERVRRATLGAHLQKLNRNELELVKKLANEVIYQQQRRIVINTFNLLSLYFASQLYSNQDSNIDDCARAIGQLKEFFEELGAHVATDMNRIKPEIIETVEIHSNIVHFENARLRFTRVAVAQLAQEIDPRRLKAHVLAPDTMAVAVPTLSLQLYINPCLFWLARPAYLILAALWQQNNEGKTVFASQNELIIALKNRVKALDMIFQHEFIVESSREDAEFQINLNFLQSRDVINIVSVTPSLESGWSIRVHENNCSRTLLSSLAPFLSLYYQLAVTLNGFPSRLDVITEFSSKEIFTRMQERIEIALRQSEIIPHIHPYCLALDNLNIALHSYIQAGFIIKKRETGLLQHATTKALLILEQELLMYLQLMPFSQYYSVTTSDELSQELASAPQPNVPAKL